MRNALITLSLSLVALTPIMAHADTISAGSIVPDASVLDTCPGCDYILASPFSASGYTVTNFTFTSAGRGDITPLLFTATTSGGNITFTLVGIGTSETVTGAGSTTFNFGLTSGTDVTAANSYFGFFSNAPVVLFSYGTATGGNYFATPALGLNGTSTSADGPFTKDTVGVLNDREYSIVADATKNSRPSPNDPGTPGVVPEPSSLVLFGTGVLSAAAAARRRFFA